ncbi:MAG: protein kinase domain-containing protein [Pyrinomonadaceae bacterium]
MTTIPVGTEFGHYAIVSLLGTGGMGEVYLARDTKLPRMVALKILSVRAAQTQRDVQRFVQEARTASALRHPNIAHIYDIGKSRGTPFIAMEYVDGVTLRKRKGMNLSEVLKVSRDVASALTAAHAAGIIHRDIKPENIMLSREGYVKVLDFGLAKYIGVPAESDAEAATAPVVFTDPGSVVGTVFYMSPEQARGFEVDARSDLWSLGAVMYELITGRPPFEANTPSDVVSLILKAEPPPLARFARDVPESLEWLVMKALVKNREERYQTARELLFDIERLNHHLAVDAELIKRTPLAPDKSAGDTRIGASGASSTDSQLTRSMNRSSNLEYLVTEIRNHKKGAAIVALVPVIMIGAYFLWSLTRSIKSPPSPPGALARLTFGQGLQTGPAWSPDGRFIAYASDGDANFDIWVQPVGGGNPVQVTRSPAHDWQPDWSPDGNSIVFRSEREGGGLFVVPAFGGRERKISAIGYRPRWSPDGQKILCLRPGERVNEYPHVFIVDLEGGPAKEISASVSANQSDAKLGLVGWHPDGQRISFLTDDGGFWTTPISAGNPVRAEVSNKVANQLKELAINLGNFRWAPTGNALFFEGESNGVTNIWRVTIDSQTLTWIDGPVRLTTGSGSDTDIALSNDGKHLAFAVTSASTRIWSVPFDPVSGKTKGTGQAITAADLDAWGPAVSPDAKELVFSVRRHGSDREELWVKSLKDASSRVLAVDDYSRFGSQWSPDGKQIAYTRYLPREPDSERSYPIALMPAGGGEEQLLTTPGPLRDYISDWSPDGRSVIASTNRSSKDRYQVAIFSLSEAPHSENSLRVIATDETHDLWGARFSPDGQWICYMMQQPSNPGVSVLNVVSISGGAAVHVTDERRWSDKPRWSPDGKTIYFVTNHSSMFLNVWGVRFDPTTGKAVGEPFRVTSFENPRFSVLTSIRQLRISLDLTHLYLPLTEVSGSVWTLSDVDR